MTVVTQIQGINVIMLEAMASRAGGEINKEPLPKRGAKGAPGVPAK